MTNNENYENRPGPRGPRADIGRRPDPRARQRKRRSLWLWGALLLLALVLILWKVAGTRGREVAGSTVVSPQIGRENDLDLSTGLMRPEAQEHQVAPPVESTDAPLVPAVTRAAAPDDPQTEPPAAPAPHDPPGVAEDPADPDPELEDEGEAFAEGEHQTSTEERDEALGANEVNEGSGGSAMSLFPKGYSPFAPASMAATKYFNEHQNEFSDMEKVQVAREPGVVEFMIRLRFPEIAPRSDAWDGQLQLESEPRVGSGIPHFVQWDERWGYKEYAGGPIGETACGPTCLAMAYAGLTGKTDYPPDKMAEFATERYHAIEDVGTAWSLFDTGIEELGLRSEHLPVDLEAFQDAIDDGKLILLSVKKGDFTSSGHFILLWNYDGQQFSILDPFNVQLGKRLWRFADLSEQCSMAWSLWAAE